VIVAGDKKFGIHVDPGLRGQLTDEEVALAVQTVIPRFRDGGVPVAANMLVDISMFEVRQRAANVAGRERAIMVAIGAGVIVLLIIVLTAVRRRRGQKTPG
jgi:hypothetical protein